MPQTIEQFVNKLQQEGVQAGQDQADKLIADAQAQADKIVADAKSQAEQIVADANAQAEQIVSRGKTDLQLAARDTINRLRDALQDGLESVLTQACKEKLNDVEFVGKCLYDIVMLYAKSDSEQKSFVEINVPADMRDQLKQWALDTIAQRDVEKARPHFDLKGTLKQAGFEYEVDQSGTTEVTLDSVVEILSSMVTPALREVLEQAVKDNRPDTHQASRDDDSD